VNAEKYQLQLEKANGRCQCVRLTGLYEKRASAEKALNQCDFFRRNVDLDDDELATDDLRFLLAYKKAEQSLRRFVRRFHLN
jgi:hypothetical protein